MNKEKLKNIIEAALMVSEKPLSMARILSLFEKDSEGIDREMIKDVIEELKNDFDGHGVELREVASGYRIQVRSDYAEWINRLFDEKPPRYSRALLETLAIIAYRQPLTRAEIEEIRGVSVSTTITRTLQEREWIRVVGHKDVPGKPELLATTKEFLDYFNLKKLSDLPSLAEIKELNQVNPDLFEELENAHSIGSDNSSAELSETGSGDFSETSVTDSDKADTEEIATVTDTDSSESEQEFPEDDNKVIPFTG